MYKKLLRKSISLLLSFSLLFQNVAPVIVLAQELDQLDPTPTEQITPSPEPTPEVTPDPTPTPAPEVTPTPTETVTPEVTPTPTEEITPTPDITPTPTEQITPSPEPTPEVTPDPTPTPAPEEPTLTASSVGSIFTDKLDYFPTDTVNVTGTDFPPLQILTIIISSSDSPAVSHSGSIFTDANGNFIYTYKLDGNYRPDYSIIVLDSSGKIIATYSFTDAPPSGCSNDSGGANDEATQKDLTRMCVDYSSLPTSIGITWDWDDASFSGSNTGDACALFDANGNGKADYAVCVQVGNNPATYITKYVYSCDDSSTTNCLGESLVSPIVGTTCSADVQNTDPFTNGSDKPKDTVASCSVNLEDVGDETAVLTDVCSYPSASTPSNASDCIVFKPNSGKLEVIKSLSPNTDTGKFNLQVDGTTYASNVGDGGDTGQQVVSVASHTIGETAVTGTDLTNYSSSVECKDVHGTGSVITTTGANPWTLNVADGDDILCVVTNTRNNNGSITIIKDASPNDAQDFSFTTTGTGLSAFSLDDDTDSTLSNTQTFSSLASGTYTITEALTTNWGLSDITCTGTGTETVDLTNRNVSISLSAGDSISCTFTNATNQAYIIVNKMVSNDNGGKAVANDFLLTVDGNAVSDEVAYPVNPGSHIVGETNLAGYTPGTWDDDCDGSGNVYVGLGETKTCTITNDDIAPKLTIVKDPTNNNGGNAIPNDFLLTVGGNAILSGVANTLASNTPYVINETQLPGYTFVNITGNEKCPTALGGTITLAPGDDITCTIKNDDIAPSITLRKSVVGGTATTDSFGLTIGSTPVGSGQELTVLANTPYTLNEAGLSGYTFTSITGDAKCPKVLEGTVMLNEDEHISCTITNTRDTGTLTILKSVDNNADGDYLDLGEALSTNWSWNISGGDQGIATGQSRSLPTGIYTISEGGQSNYHLVDWTCTDGTTGNTNTIPANVTVNGLTCTFNNAINTGTIIVHKDVEGPNGEDIIDTSNDFTVTLDGSNPQLLTDNGTVSYINVPVGQHTVDEYIVPTGYTLSSQTPDIDVNLPGIQINVTTGDNNVYFVNRQQSARVTVHKDVLNPDNVQIFDDHVFQVTIDGDIENVRESASADFTLIPGTYTISEITDQDYELVSISPDADPNSLGTQITLTPGQGLDVYVVNKQKKATVYVNKNVFAADGTSDILDNHTFNVTLNGQTKDFSENSRASFTVNPGNYSAVEGTDLNYTFVSNSGQASVDPNGVATIYIVNKQNPGSILGYKFNGDGTTGIDNWAITLLSCDSGFISCIQHMSTTTTSSGYYQFLGLNTGYYRVSEETKPDWSNLTPTTIDISLTTSGATSLSNNFTNFQNVSVTACKNIDSDGSLDTTSDQTPRSGWTVNLLTDGVVTNTQVTLENGCYTWTNLGPSHSYSVSENVPSSGWTALTDTLHNFGTAQSGRNESFTFINFDNGYISGHKFNDLNGNGVWDKPTEQAIEGWTISARYPDNSIHTRTTNASGYYSFSDLEAGTYSISEENQTNWNPTTPTSGKFDIVMTSGGAFAEKDFGNRGYGTITVHKDIIGTTTDLTQFCFTLSPDPEIGEVCSNTQGDAVFNNVPSGTYTAAETKSAPSYTRTATTCESGMTITIGGDNRSCIVTNTRDRGEVTFEKLVDDNSNVSGWSFNIRGIEETFHSGDSVTLDTGDYTVTESGSSDYSPFSVGGICTGLEGSVATLNVTEEGGTCTFTNHVNKGTIKVTKITHPSEWDGSFDFTLYKDNESTDEASLSDGEDYSFNDLFPGNYSLSEVHEGWALTTRCFDDNEASVDPSDIDLTAGGTITCTFTNTKYGSISGYKWNDANGNSERDCSFLNDEETRICEDKLIDWTIFIDSNNNGELESQETFTETDSDGNYRFSDLLPGTYSVCEVEQEGWTRTYPLETNCHTVRLSAGDQLEDFNFGNVQKEPRLILSKSNNADADKLAGQDVTFTLTLQVLDNDIKNVIVRDLPASGFKYRTGTWVVNSSIWGLLTTIPEPLYHSPGDWILGNLQKGEIITMSYVTDIDTSQLPGQYPDLAYAKGIFLDETKYATGDNGQFVGTDVNVVKDQTQTENYSIEKEEIQKVTGEVLGASTDLPATGANTHVLFFALINLGLGIQLIRSAKKENEE